MIVDKYKLNGFTLVEILVYIAISSLLLLSLTAHIVFTNQLKNRSEISGRVTTEINHVESVLHTTVRSAGSIISPIPGNGHDELMLEMKDESQGNVTFSYDADTITRSDAKQSAQPLTSNQVRITNVSFYNLSRSDTSGSVRYEYFYEWADETNQTQSASSSGIISLR